MREDFRGCGRWPDQLLLRISHLSRAAACCTIESLPPHPPLPPGGSSGGNHSACSPAKMRALASSQEEPASGFRSYSSRRASIIAFSCSLSSPLSNHVSLSSSFSLARISRRSSALSLGSASRISALIMAEIYRGQQGAASKRLGKKRYPFPAPPSSILTEHGSETRAIHFDASHLSKVTYANKRTAITNRNAGYVGLKLDWG